MNKRKYFLLIKIAAAALVIFSAALISCPPLDEESFDNTITVSGILTQSRWIDILDDIYYNGIPVKLDLSACVPPSSGGDILKQTHENGADYTPATAINQWDNYIQFNPSMGSRFGKDLIESIILPNVATMISNASDKIDIETIFDTEDDELNRYAFRHFTNLRSVTGRNISLIGTFAFYNCTSIEEVSFPNVVIVMQYAFFNCTSIRRFEFEKLRHIQPSAFESCTSLETVEFHNADVIPQRAFMNCTSLVEVSFSGVMKVEPDAFRNCTSLIKARFLANPLRTTGGHPMAPWRASAEIPYTEDTLAFHNNVFRGCTSLLLLDVRNAWNVYFGAGALADIGTYLELHLYDDAGPVNGLAPVSNRSYGHPQVELILGGTHPDINIGSLTLKELKIIANSVDPELHSQILYADTASAANDGTASIRNRINAVYNPGPRHIDYNEPVNPVVKVTIERRP
ncbi:MAG: leucine-rich repeat domain-containing protein [Treponema sp.]|nr:leucine-rich repeat domain-containing protein [Treponema sp.]